MNKKITVLGSTGSIGQQTLEVARRFPGELQVVGLTANGSYEMLEDQIRKHRPEKVALKDIKACKELRARVKDIPVQIYEGNEGILDVAADTSANLVLVALIGFSGLKPTLWALKAGKEIALANKEALVVGGNLLIKEAKKQGLNIYPVDSEHSAIFQCLEGIKKEHVKRIILTASGGPFRGWPPDKLQEVTPAKALQHPNWSMGKKITIDSSTLMNKGFEVLEAKWLFDLDLSKIDVIVHPESIVHSLVECIDHSVIAQCGLPDMTNPIQYALFYPHRRANQSPSLDLTKYTLTFEAPEYETFPCLKLAYEAGERGGTMPACLNAANEIAVSMFLKEKIPFVKIPSLISAIMNKHDIINDPDLDDIIASDRWARAESLKLCGIEEGEY